MADFPTTIPGSINIHPDTKSKIIRSKEVRIIIKEQVPPGRAITMPVTPEEIEFLSGGTRFVTYELLDRGEVKIPRGENLRRVKWDSIFPAYGHYLPHAILEPTIDPKKYQTVLSEWDAYGVPLKLIITNTPINMNVYLADYSVTYSGAYGDYDYSVEFVDRKEIKIKTVRTIIEDDTEGRIAHEAWVESERIRMEAERERIARIPDTYTAVSGDTFWSIAERFLGDGSKWEEVYKLNETIKIEYYVYDSNYVQNNRVPASHNAEMPQFVTNRAKYEILPGEVLKLPKI